MGHRKGRGRFQWELLVQEGVSVVLSTFPFPLRDGLKVSGPPPVGQERGPRSRRRGGRGGRLDGPRWRDSDQKGHRGDPGPSLHSSFLLWSPSGRRRPNGVSPTPTTLEVRGKVPHSRRVCTVAFPSRRGWEFRVRDPGRDECETPRGKTSRGVSTCNYDSSNVAQHVSLLFSS